MPVYSIQYTRLRGEPSPERGRALPGPAGGCVQLEAPDRVAAFAAALDLFRLEGIPVFVTSHAVGNPLGFSAADLQEVAVRGLPFSTGTPHGEAIQVVSVELHRPAYL
jgi:hypothetical protein